MYDIQQINIANWNKTNMNKFSVTSITACRFDVGRKSKVLQVGDVYHCGERAKHGYDVDGSGMLIRDANQGQAGIQSHHQLILEPVWDETDMGHQQKYLN